MAFIEIDSITKVYESGEIDVVALDGISLKIKQGEFVSVVGPSGCGKSTLMHILGGVDVPEIGTVKYGDVDITALDEPALTVFRRKNIGLVYQFYNLIPSLTALENITLPCLLDSKKSDKEYLSELIDMLGLGERLNHYPSQLSGGQQQRVAIARALINRPQVVLADEPTGNLDKANSLQTLELLQRANELFEQTIIIVTHSGEIAQMAKRIITMEDGKIINEAEVVACAR